MSDAPLSPPSTHSSLKTLSFPISTPHNLAPVVITPHNLAPVVITHSKVQDIKNVFPSLISISPHKYLIRTFHKASSLSTWTRSSSCVLSNSEMPCLVDFVPIDSKDRLSLGISCIISRGIVGRLWLLLFSIFHLLCLKHHHPLI